MCNERERTVYVFEKVKPFMLSMDQLIPDRLPDSSTPSVFSLTSLYERKLAAPEKIAHLLLIYEAWLRLTNRWFSQSEWISFVRGQPLSYWKSDAPFS